MLGDMSLQHHTTLVAALGSGLIAGTFFAFSTFVMPALARLPVANGVAAMQAINVVVVNRWFMGVFGGTALACAGLGVASIATFSRPGAGLRLAGSVVYLAGTLAVTAACNVPRNEALAAVDATGPVAAQMWPRYVADWSLWNHVRGVAALSTTALLVLSLLRSRAAA